MSDKKHIRVVALARIKHPDGRDFVNEFTDRANNNRKFYRLSGGGVEFGELAAEALKREFMEEYGIEIIVGERLEARENIFHYIGIGHEIVLVFAAEFADKTLYDKEVFQNIEDEAHKDDSGIWMDLSTLTPNGNIFFKE